jgi:hypothetical protein
MCVAAAAAKEPRRHRRRAEPVDDGAYRQAPEAALQDDRARPDQHREGPPLIRAQDGV